MAKAKGKAKGKASPQPAKEKNTRAPKKTKANTRWAVNGELEYRGATGWILAVYHNDIRAQLLAEGPQGIYDFPRKKGKGINDITSFHPDYARTGPDRQNRHEILFRYEQNGYTGASYIPDVWMYRDRIVLDLDDEPVKKWHEIPLVLSSAYEGYEMEVVRRLNQNIEWQDFRARMPSMVQKTKKTEPLSKINGLLPAACHAANSTRGFRDLTGYEIMEAQAPNKGSFLNRAGNRALPDETRKERNAVDEKRKAKLWAQHIEIVGAAPRPATANPRPLTRAQKRKQAEEQSPQREDRAVAVESRTRGRKRKLTESLSDSEDDKDKNRPDQAGGAAPQNRGRKRKKIPSDSGDDEDENQPAKRHRAEGTARRNKRQPWERQDTSSEDEGENDSKRPTKRAKRAKGFEITGQDNKLSGSRVQNPNLGAEFIGNPPFLGGNPNPGPPASSPVPDFGPGVPWQNYGLSGSHVQDPNLGAPNLEPGGFNGNSPFLGGNSNPGPPDFRPVQELGARDSGQNNDIWGSQDFGFEEFDGRQPSYPSPNAPDVSFNPYFGAGNSGQNNDGWATNLSAQNIGFGGFNGNSPFPAGNLDLDPPLFTPVQDFGAGDSGKNNDEHEIFEEDPPFSPSADALDDMSGPYFGAGVLGQYNGLSGSQVHENLLFSGEYPSPNAPGETSGPSFGPGGSGQNNGLPRSQGRNPNLGAQNFGHGRFDGNPPFAGGNLNPGPPAFRPVHDFGAKDSGQNDELLGSQVQNPILGSQNSGYGGSHENPPFSGGYPPQDGFHQKTNTSFLPPIERVEGSDRYVGQNAPNSTDQHSMPNFDDPRWQPMAANQHEPVPNSMPNLDPQGQPFAANQDQPSSDSFSDLGDSQSPPSAAGQDERPEDDNRYHIPENQWEEMTILNALQFTREDHQERLNSPRTIPTTEQKCYYDQWAEMQKTFEQRWSRRNEGTPPTLVLMDAWTGELDNWTPKDPDWKIRMFPTESEAEEERRKNGQN